MHSKIIVGKGQRDSNKLKIGGGERGGGQDNQVISLS